MARLRRVDCSAQGITRRRSGRGFIYLDEAGRRIHESQTLDRLCALAIPPAWNDVWICPHPHGHLQAVGTDSAGRRQYLYHERWRARRDQEKFDRMLDFAASLPAMRRKVASDLSMEGMPAERTLACAARLLDRGLFRIGSESYAEENGSFGLATLRKKHVVVRGDELQFDYAAKGGRRRMLSINDPDAAEVIRTLKRRRGASRELLAYREGREWRDVRSADVNQYLKTIVGDDFSAKDFRTWHATVLMAFFLSVSQTVSLTKTARKRSVSAAIKLVSEQLGNTPAVCRTSYIDPRVIDGFRSGQTISDVVRGMDPNEMDNPATQARIEAAVLELLTGSTHGSAEPRAA